MTRISLSFFCLLGLVACNRQFEVTVNERSVYDPRAERDIVRVADPGLQGCANLALNQLESGGGAGGLQSLSCTNTEVASLDGLQQLSGLRFLDLSGNVLTDLTPLESLRELSVVVLSNNQIVDIAALLAMPRLTAAVLTGNPRIPCVQLDRLQSRLGDNLSRPQECR